MKLLQDAPIKDEFMKTIIKCFEKSKTKGNVERDRWKELKQTIMEASKEHWQWKKKKRKKWISECTVHISEAKRKAYTKWWDCRMQDAGRQREY